MSRRHHHHMQQPYEYRFGAEHRDRDRDRERAQARGIEYQDDSLSSINSDEESYLHHTTKEKKTPHFYQKPEQNNKITKIPDKPSNSEVKIQNQSVPDATSQRLERLETMLEQLIKRNINTPAVENPVPERRGQFSLDPRKHDFTTSMWINKIQEVSIQNNWDEKTTIAYMENQLSGIMKAWFNSLDSYNYTWPEWKILISKVFPDNIDFITTLKRLVTRLKQADESINTYYFSKMYLIDACKITGEDAVSCLIDGLNNQSIQEQAKSQSYLTPETLYSQFLTVLPEYTVDYSPDTVLTNWCYEEEEEPQQTEDFDYQQRQQKRPVPVHSRLDKRFIRTNNFRQNNKIPMAAKVCTICGGRGHLARNCRKADKILKTSLPSTKNSQCYYKKCTIDGCHKLGVFIDTGCTTVIIRHSEFENLKLPKIPVSETNLEAYGGYSTPILAKTRFLLQIDGAKAHVEAVIVPDHCQDVPIIVGQEFLNRKNICVFLGKEKLKIFEAPI